MSDDLPDEPIADRAAESPPGEAIPAGEETQEIGPTFDLSIFIEPRSILCQFQCAGRRRGMDHAQIGRPSRV